MFGRCAINRWKSTRQLPSTLLRSRLLQQQQQRTITTTEPIKSATSPLPHKVRPWRQLVALAIISIPGSFIAYYFLDPGLTSQESFGKYKLVSKEPVSSSAAIFHIKPQNSTQELGRYKDIWRQGIWNVQFKQPQLQILRAYTPLPPLPSSNEDGVDTATLRFLIRNDPRGEVSGYLHRLTLESTIEVRGPSLEHLVGQDVKEVIFLAGGTGVAPALQVAHAMFDGLSAAETQDKRLHILWANRKREDCEGSRTSSSRLTTSVESTSWSKWFSWVSEPRRTEITSIPRSTAMAAATREEPTTPNPIVRHLSALEARYPGQISITYFIDEEDTRVDSKNISGALSLIATTTEPKGNRKEIIVSGPPGFIGYLAGPKVWQNGMEEQGPLCGLVGAELAKRKDLGNVKVWKV